MRTNNFRSIEFSAGLGLGALVLSLSLSSGFWPTDDGGQGLFEGGNTCTPGDGPKGGDGVKPALEGGMGLNEGGGQLQPDADYDEGGHGFAEGGNQLTISNGGYGSVVGGNTLALRDGTEGGDGVKPALEGGQGLMEGGNELAPSPDQTEGVKGYWDGEQGGTGVGNGYAQVLRFGTDGSRQSELGLVEGRNHLVISEGVSGLWEGGGYLANFPSRPTEGPKPGTTEGPKGFSDEYPEGVGGYTSLAIDGPKGKRSTDGNKPASTEEEGGSFSDPEGGKQRCSLPEDVSVIGNG